MLRISKILLLIHLLVSLSNCTSGNAAENSKNENESVKATSHETKMEDRQFKELRLARVIQSKVIRSKDPLAVYEPAINSPKSVIYSEDGS